MGLISNGTTIFDNGAMTSGAGSMTLVSSATASSSASIEFSLGSYKEYKFFFVNMHPASDGVSFSFQTSIDNGSNYNVTTTSTLWQTNHQENDAGGTALTYETGADQAQGTAFQQIVRYCGADADQCFGGYLHLFNPSSTTYVKHYIARTNMCHAGDQTEDCYTAGYFNDTNDLTNIKFQFSSGNIDDGKILCFGLN